MDLFKIPVCYINMFFMWGGTYETIETVKKTRHYRIEKCKLHLGGRTYIGLIRYDKHYTAIVDILEDGSCEDCYADFWETCDKIEKKIPREVIAFTIGRYLLYRNIVWFMRAAMVIGFFIFWYTGRATSPMDYIFAGGLVVMVFGLSRPFLNDSTKNL